MNPLARDLATMAQLNALFERPRIRFARITTEMGIPFTIFSAIDMVKAVLQCDYIVAQGIVVKLFRDYHAIDLDGDEALHSHGPQLHRAIFPGPSVESSLSLTLSIADTLELLFLLPGREPSAQYRLAVADAMIRVQGGDPALSDQILARRTLRDYLRDHDQENPLRAAGDAAVARAVAEEEMRAREKILAKLRDSSVVTKTLRRFKGSVAWLGRSAAETALFPFRKHPRRSGFIQLEDG